MRKLLLTVLATAMLPTMALASEESASPGLFSGDVGVAIWTVIIFALVVFVLARYAWGPMLNALQARETFIRDSLQKAASERESAEQLLRDYEQKLAAARAEATAIVEEARRDAESVKTKVEQAAREEGERLIDRARQEIGLARDKAVKDLYRASSQLATDLASRILRREIRPEDHERLISESLAQLGDEPEN
jgi:F-type H+-transporting ATPase subunit b